MHSEYLLKKYDTTFFTVGETQNRVSRNPLLLKDAQSKWGKFFFNVTLIRHSPSEEDRQEGCDYSHVKTRGTALYPRRLDTHHTQKGRDGWTEGMRGGEIAREVATVFGV